MADISSRDSGVRVLESEDFYDTASKSQYDENTCNSIPLDGFASLCITLKWCFLQLYLCSTVKNILQQLPLPWSQVCIQAQSSFLKSTGRCSTSLYLSREFLRHLGPRPSSYMTFTLSTHRSLASKAQLSLLIPQPS